ncbi:GNAT family N-acetyltransferase [Enterococcus florum]|uniref:GNAT family N-acetyltransferase n=1 Tax=Enterococcus florum TaxID=2480627 RepID=UPI00158AC087
MKLRVAKPADASKLLAIYKPFVEKTAVTFEYQVPTVEEFRQRIETTLQTHPYLVAENQEGALLGYAYAHAYKEREAYDWSVEVTIYLADRAQGLGIGTKLYRALEQELAKQHILVLTACITGGNQKSVAFHESFGYTMVGNFKAIGYKFGQWHDVYWMQKQLEAPCATIEKVIPYSKVMNQLNEKQRTVG